MMIEFVEQHVDLWDSKSDKYKNRENIHVWIPDSGMSLQVNTMKMQM